MSLIFLGKSIDECLENASKELNIMKEKIKYKIIKERHLLIGKNFQIEVIDTESDILSSNDGLVNTNNLNIEEIDEKQKNEIDSIINEETNWRKR